MDTVELSIIKCQIKINIAQEISDNDILWIPSSREAENKVVKLDVVSHDNLSLQKRRKCQKYQSLLCLFVYCANNLKLFQWVSVVFFNLKKLKISLEWWYVCQAAISKKVWVPSDVLSFFL